MRSSVDDNNDITKLVSIFTDDFGISIPQKILVESSHFFKAALQSGMSESRSGEFFLSEFSPRQLLHLQHFLADNDLFTSNVESPQGSSGQSMLSDCKKEEHVRRLVEAASIADYLQMPRFKSRLQILFRHLLQYVAQFHSPCFLRRHDCNIFTEMIPVLSDDRLKCLRKPLLRFVYRYPTVFIDSKFVHLDISQSHLIKSVLQTLSSDKVFLLREDEILYSACEWIQHSHSPPKRCRVEDNHINEVLLSLVCSLRLGLLSPAGLRKLADVLEEYPQHVIANSTLNCCLTFVQLLFSRNLHSHFQATLCTHLVHYLPLIPTAFRPRADLPTLILVARQNSPPSFIFYFLNLLTGKVLSCPAPLFVERTLLFEPSESNPIHLCTAEAANSQNLVFLFIHQINTATLKGMVWDLATLQAEWLPDLDLKHASFAWATTSLSTFSLPHAVGVVFTADGLVVYCSFTLCMRTVLCVYRFDASSWEWVKYNPKAMDQGSVAGRKVLKPMPHATAQGVGERWLYGTLDSAEGSQFIRMRPASASVCGNYSVQFETLPSPNFILRAYNLVSVHNAAAEDGEHEDAFQSSATFTFPFNACQRDSQAMRMCYSGRQKIWRSWEPTVSGSTSPSSSSPPSSTSSLPTLNEPLRFALSRKHIGFRGVVYTSSLAIPRRHHVRDREEGERGEEEEEEEDDEVDVEVGEGSIKPSEELESTLRPGSYFVMAGRLAQSVSPPSPKVSGVWLLNPWTERALVDIQQPTFALPPDLDGLLHRATAVCGAVGLANWTALRASIECSNGWQETQSTRLPSQSLLAPPIMRFAPSLGRNGDGAGGIGAGLSGPSSSTASLFAFHHHSSGAGSDSD